MRDDLVRRALVAAGKQSRLPSEGNHWVILPISEKSISELARLRVFGREAMRPLLFISALGALVPWVIALLSALMLIMALFSSFDWLFAHDSDAGLTALIEYLYAAAGIGIITLVSQLREMLLRRSERPSDDGRNGSGRGWGSASPG